MGTQVIEEEVNKNMLKAKIISTSHVKPKKAIGRRECQLVTFDLPYIAFYYNQKLMIYKGVVDFDDLVVKMKDGLALVLEEFHQLAGKLGKYEDGVFKVEYDDDMDGVEVVVAAAEEISVAELTKEEGTARLKELVPYNGVLNLEGLHRPLLGVQVHFNICRFLFRYNQYFIISICFRCLIPELIRCCLNSRILIRLTEISFS